MTKIPRTVEEQGGAPAVVPSRARRILRGVGRALAALALLILAALALVLHDLDGEVREALAARTGEVARVIGRPVTLGAVHVAVGLTAEIVVRDVVVAGAEGATGALAEPLLRLPTIRLGVRLAPLVRSWGKSIIVTRFELEDPEITVVRTAAGLSIDDVRARLAASPPRPKPSARVALEGLAIHGATLHLRVEGGAPGEELDLSAIAVTGADLRLDAPSRLTVTAASAPGATLGATLDFAPPAGAAPGARSAIQRAAIQTAALRLAPILGWLRARAAPSIDLADAALDLDASVELNADVVVRAKAKLSAARLARIDASGERVLGAPMQLALALDATVDPAAEALTARSLEVAIGGATARGRLTLHGFNGAPVVDALELDGAADAAAILAVLPAGAAPRGVAVAGPIALALRVSDSGDAARGTVKLDLHELRLVDVSAAGHEEPGDPTAVAFHAAVAFTKASRALSVTEAELSLGDLVVRGDVAARGLPTAPTIDALTLAASGPLERLVALTPPSRRRAGLTLRGPFAATLKASGAPGDLAGRLALDLDRAAVRAPGLHKPAGARLGVDLEGRVTTGLDLTHGAIRLGALTLGARGKVASAEHFDLAFDFREAGLGPLLTLFPEAGARLAGATIEGQIEGKGTLHRDGATTELATDLRLRGALIRRGAVAILGAPHLAIAVKTTSNKISARVDADLGAATLAVAPVFSKAAGRPARLAFVLTREGESVHVDEARLALPGASLEGLTLAIEPHAVHVAITAATVALGPLAEMVPLLGAVLPPKLANATASFGLDLRGDPADPASAQLRVTALDLRGGFGRVAGSVEVDGLAPPRAVRFDVSDGALDLGALAGPDGGDGPALDGLGAVTIAGRVHLDTLRARGETAHPVDADLAFERGRLAVKSLRAGLLGGALDVEPSWIDLAATPEVDLHARLDAIDLARLDAGAIDELRGRASGRVDLHAKGEGTEALTRSLRGAARLALRDVHARRVFNPKVTVVNPILGDLFARAMKKHAGVPVALDLREASALLDVGSGALTTTEPILLRSDDLVARLRGTIGFDRAIALDGQLEISPRVVAVVTDRALVPVRPIPLRLRIVGPSSALQLELLELGETVLALRGALRNGLAGGAAATLR